MIANNDDATPPLVISKNLFFNIGYSIPQYTVMKKPTVICKLPIPKITIEYEKKEEG
jgi:hypothetical protein